MSAELWPMWLVVVVNTLLFHALPRLSRPDILFAVTVPDAFASSGDAAAIVRKYRTVVWLSALVSMGVMTAWPAGYAGVAFVGMHVAGVCGAWTWANRRVRPHATPAPAIRVAALAPRDTGLPGGVVFAAGPLVIVAAAAVFMWLNDAGVHPQLVIGAAVTSMMLAMAWTIVSRTRQVALDEAAATGERTFKRVSALHLLFSAYAVAGMSAALTVVPVLRGTDELPMEILLPLGAVIVVSWGFVLALIWLGQGGQRGVAPEARAGLHGDATPDAAWKGGLIYYNPNDPALLVERRMGIGWTFNMANRWSWVILGAMVLAIVISNVLR